MFTGGFVTDVMRHAAGLWRKNRHVHAALALNAQLIFFDGFADFVVTDFEVGRKRGLRGRGQRGDLLLAIVAQCFGRGGVVAVTIDNHKKSFKNKCL